MKENAPILIVGPSWVGDMVMAQVLFRLLRERHPHSPIDVLAPAWSHPLLERMPEVRDALVMPLGHGRLGLRERHRLGRRLRPAQYGWSITLPNSFKSALIPFWAHIPRRTGFVGELRWGVLNDARRLNKTALPRTVDRFAALALGADEELPSPLPDPRLAADIYAIPPLLQRLGLGDDPHPILALCPGAEYGPAKQWPVSHFAQLARRQAARGWRVWIIGSEKEKELGNQIADAATLFSPPPTDARDAFDLPAEEVSPPAITNLAGTTALGEAVDLLSLAAAVVTNDSGLMHVAAALGVRVLALFGSSDPNHTPPLGRHAGAISLGLACAPCFKRQCPLGHLDCLTGISPATIGKLLDGVP